MTGIAIMFYIFHYLTTTEVLDKFGGKKVEYNMPKKQNMVDKITRLYNLDVKPL